MEEAALDDIIDRLLDVRNGRPGKPVNLTEQVRACAGKAVRAGRPGRRPVGIAPDLCRRCPQEIRLLCLTAKEIFMGQPNLLELEAPIKICGTRAARWRALVLLPELPAIAPRPPSQETSTASTPTCCGYSSTAASRPRPTTCSWATTLTAASRAWRPSACCWRTRCVCTCVRVGKGGAGEAGLGYAGRRTPPSGKGGGWPAGQAAGRGAPCHGGAVREPALHPDPFTD